MVQLKVLSGKKAGFSWEARRFPVRVGRSTGSDLQIEEAGVWDDHLKISLDPLVGFVLETNANAIASINHQAVQRATLRNGDTIEIGSVRLQFWLGEARQRGQAWREVLAWAVIVGVCLGQIGLVYWLINTE